MASDFFSADYFAARDRFREAVTDLGWPLETYPIQAKGPHGEELTFDVADSRPEQREKTLILSSGLHGVESFFGSAVQLAQLRKWRETNAPRTRCLLFHALNPYGFAWLRRFDENNVDPNRNFLLPGESYSGSPPHYDELDSFLNPPRPPSMRDAFLPKALAAYFRHGLTTLTGAIAGGQYEYPKGLFFGGEGPSEINRLLTRHLPRWLEGSREVFHFDFHTGLGRSGTWKLLIDHPLTDAQRQRLIGWFGSDSYSTSDESDETYHASGGFGRWCVESNFVPDYLYTCAEFGTKNLAVVLKALRAENQAHHWGEPDDPSTRRAKQKLRDAFCPNNARWRDQVIHEASKLVDQAIEGLES